MKKKQNKAIKYRIYPTKEQEVWLAKCFGSCRYIYNQALTWRTLAYNANHTSLSYNDTAYGLTKIKKQNTWLREADSVALQQSLRNLDTAYRNFFQKRTGFPKYKSKKTKQSYTTMNQNGTVSITLFSDKKGVIKLPKVKEVHAVIHRKPPKDWVLKSATVSRETDGKYYCSLLFEYEDDVKYFEGQEVVQDVIGLDYKSDGLYASSEGDTCGSPKYYRNSQKKLAKQQRILARRCGYRKGEPKSKRFEKQKIKVNKIYRKVSNQRKDFLHKESLSIAKKYSLVCVEDLNMRNLSCKPFHNGKSTMDNGYGMFLDFLDYKLKDRGKILQKVDKWYPSSQICSKCGCQNKDMKNLSIRTFFCHNCKTSLDRDVNAAINIKNEGIRRYLQSIGLGQPESTPVEMMSDLDSFKLSSLKQEVLTSKSVVQV